MKPIKQMPKIEDNEVYQWLDKKLGQFRMGWISGFLFCLSIFLAINSKGLVIILPIMLGILNFKRFTDGK